MLKDIHNSELQLLYAVLIDKLLEFSFYVTNIPAHICLHIKNC